MINDLNYERVKFPGSKKGFCRIEKENNICINVFCYENGLTYILTILMYQIKSFIILWICC